MSGHFYCGLNSAPPPPSSSSTETSRLLCLPFFFLQTLLPYEVKEAYKIFIPFLCRNRVKSVTVTASPSTKLFFYTVVQMKQVEPRRFCTIFAAIWVWPIKLLLFYLVQFPLCGCMLFICPGFANSTFNSAAQRCILGVQSFSHSFLGLLSTLIHTQLAVCVEKHSHTLFSWLIGSDSKALCLTKIWYTETQSFRSSRYHRADHPAICLDVQLNLLRLVQELQQLFTLSNFSFTP